MLSPPITELTSMHDCYPVKVLHLKLKLKPEKEVSVYSKPYWSNYRNSMKGLVLLAIFPTHLPARYKQNQTTKKTEFYWKA